MAWPNIFQRGALLSQFSHHHVVVFLLTFFSYSLLHASRKTFSNVKVSISKQWTPSAFNKSIELPVEIWSSNHLFPSAEEATLFLGTLDTIFLFSYAVGLFISGIVGDRLNLRWVLSFGMCSSALVVFVFGTLTEWLHFYNKGLYCSLWIVNGLLQSSGWPCVVAVMGNWFGKAGRGVVFGLWSACASVGNILGACLASSVLQYGYEYSLAYACLKLVNYSFFFWLPFYLSNNFGWKEAEADKLSIWYDVGGIIVFSVFDPGQPRMDVGFLLFHSYDKLHNSIYFTINSEGNMLSYAKTRSSHIEWVTGAHKRTRISGLFLFIHLILGLS
ncbi:sugar phosphate exchanger 3 isoform X5 [Phocoena phocoena]|uniref:sugar phosphate exchanger 3 isoform X5 n=1 Tax=Phocoena phocoena TaxID=9742 RepID=UPI003307A5B6